MNFSLTSIQQWLGAQGANIMAKLFVQTLPLASANLITTILGAGALGFIAIGLFILLAGKKASVPFILVGVLMVIVALLGAGII